MFAMVIERVSDQEVRGCFDKWNECKEEVWSDAVDDAAVVFINAKTRAFADLKRAGEW